MIRLIDEKVYYASGRGIVSAAEAGKDAYKNTIAYSILASHNVSGREDELQIKFDALTSHDITYVGIIQTARASGMDHFPIPYALTNCHNSLCAVGGTINEDDHVFGYTAAKKYGGIFVPAHRAVIHSFAREMLAASGSMVLGSDSHTRYGALGCMGIGEGGPELVKQLLSRTYDLARPEVILIDLEGEVRPGVGPHDVALAIVGAVFKNGFVKNKVMEFGGSGLKNLPVDFRAGIDVMTTETACLSSIWETDDEIRAYYENHRRPEAFRTLSTNGVAAYDGAVVVDLSAVEPMIALPFHPSNTYTIREFTKHAGDLLGGIEEEIYSSFGLRVPMRDKITSRGVRADQAVIAGCAGGTFDNLTAAADILQSGAPSPSAFHLDIYAGSQPILAALLENGVASRLIAGGAILKTCFCGPCFGAGDVPANCGLSIRHSTRNFPNRDGSKPREGQMASVALMDARSIAMSAKNGGIITPADEGCEIKRYAYHYDPAIYEKTVYFGQGKPQKDEKLVLGPNITDWPAQEALKDDLLVEIASYITDEVTTTDELIPSGETSSYRSNPLRLAEFTLSRKDPGYVGRMKKLRAYSPEELVEKVAVFGAKPESVTFGGAVAAKRPGDGSAREQAASSQRVLGGAANIAIEYATKRYRSNLINWGMLPFTLADAADFEKLAVGSLLYVPGIREGLEKGESTFEASLFTEGNVETIRLSLGRLTPDERDIILRGCLINYYAAAL